MPSERRIAEGRIAWTRDSIPFLSNPAPGLWAGMGCNGRGVGMGTVMGRLLAEAVCGKPHQELGFPVTMPKPYPFHRFYPIGVAVRFEPVGYGEEGRGWAHATVAWAEEP